MKYTILAAVTALVAGVAVTAHAQDVRSTAGVAQPAGSNAASTAPTPNASPAAGNTAESLNALLADWDRAGFNPPSKPSQYRVYGRNGYVTTGPGYNAMVALIRSAVSDAQQGRDHDAALEISRARSLLAGITPSATHANG
jgi:hypothetical protein